MRGIWLFVLQFCTRDGYFYRQFSQNYKKGLQKLKKCCKIIRYGCGWDSSHRNYSFRKGFDNNEKQSAQKIGKG